MKEIKKARKEPDHVKKKKEEELILQAVTQNKALMGVHELAQGVKYTVSIKTSWKPPDYITLSKIDKIRRKYSIAVSGQDVPPTLKILQGYEISDSYYSRLDG